MTVVVFAGRAGQGEVQAVDCPLAQFGRGRRISPDDQSLDLVESGVENVVCLLDAPGVFQPAAELEQRESQQTDRRDIAVDPPLVTEAVDESSFSENVIERRSVLGGHQLPQ